MTIQNVHFISKVEAEKSPGHVMVAVISIGDPASEPAKLSPHFSNIFRLKFSDVDSEDEDYYVVFNRKLAKEVWDYLLTLPPHVDTLLVHCHLGISRSAAVAKAAAGYFGAPFPQSYSLYNKKVYSVMQSEINSRLYPDSTLEY